MVKYRYNGQPVRFTRDSIQNELKSRRGVLKYHRGKLRSFAKLARDPDKHVVCVCVFRMRRDVIWIYIYIYPPLSTQVRETKYPRENCQHELHWVYTADNIFYWLRVCFVQHCVVSEIYGLWISQKFIIIPELILCYPPACSYCVARISGPIIPAQFRSRLRCRWNNFMGRDFHWS